MSGRSPSCRADPTDLLWLRLAAPARHHMFRECVLDVQCRLPSLDPRLLSPCSAAVTLSTEPPPRPLLACTVLRLLLSRDALYRAAEALSPSTFLERLFFQNQWICAAITILASRLVPLWYLLQDSKRHRQHHSSSSSRPGLTGTSSRVLSSATDDDVTLWREIPGDGARKGERQAAQY